MRICANTRVTPPSGSQPSPMSPGRAKAPLLTRPVWGGRMGEMRRIMGGSTGYVAENLT